MTSNLERNDYIMVGLFTALWLNASGLLRFFTSVIPGAQAFLPEVEGVAAVTLGTLTVWSGWGVLQAFLYVFIFWLCVQAFGNNAKSIVASALVNWSYCFIIVWVAIANMGFAAWDLAIMAIGWTFFESIVASIIMSKKFVAYQQTV